MRKFLKVFLIILGSILLLIFLAMLWLSSSWGKEFVRKQTISFLSKKIGTEVTIQHLEYSIPDKIGLYGVLFKDQQQDTMLALGTLSIDMDMLDLLRARLTVDQLLVDSLDARIYRRLPDSVFNYQYIIDAFATPDDTHTVASTDTSSGSSLLIDVAKVSLQHINLLWEDETGGLIMNYQLKDLLLRPAQVDLEAMNFTVDELKINGFYGSVITDTSYLPPEPEDTTASTNFLLAMDKLQLDTIKFTFESRTSPMLFDIELQSLKGKLREFNLQDEFIDVAQLQLENTQSALVFGKTQNTTIDDDEADETTEEGDGWRILGDDLLLKNIAFRYDDENEPKQQVGMDYAHMDFTELYLNANQVAFQADSISGNLKHLSVKEKSGLNLIELRSQFVYTDQGARLKDFLLETPNTRLADLMEVSYPSLETLQQDMSKIKLNLVLQPGKVGMKDVFLFLPSEQRQQLKAYANETFNIKGKINGYLSALRLQDLYLRGLDGTELSLHGQLQGLPNADRLRYQLDINTLRSTFADIRPFLPAELQEQVRIPDWFQMSGTLSGTTKDYFPNLLVRTSDGDAKIDGELSLSGGEGKERYDLLVQTNQLNLGHILKMDSVLGPVSVAATVVGTGFDTKQMNAQINASVSSAWYNGYNYNKVFLKGSIADQVASFDGYGQDPNLDFTLDGQADLSGEYPAVTANLNLLNINPYALQFTNDSITLKGLIQADFSSLNPDYPKGTLAWWRPLIITESQQLAFDSLIVYSMPDVDSGQQIKIGLDKFFRASLNGHVPLTQIGNVALAHINRHYQISDTISADLQQYDLDLDASLNYDYRMRRWLPSLRPFDTVRISADVDPSTILLNAYVPGISYGTIQVDSLIVDIRENQDTMSYRLSANKVQQDQLNFWYPSLSGRVRQDSVYAYINIRDTARKSQFGIGGALHQDLLSDSGLTYFRLFRGLRFDYDVWNVNPNNRLVFGPQGFYVRDFQISKDNQSIYIQSDQEQFNAPLQLNIQNFALSNVTKMLSTDTLLADGTLQVDARVDMAGAFPKLKGLLTVDELEAYEKPIGKLTAVVENNSATSVTTRIDLYGQENNVELNGNYYLAPVDSNEFDFDLAIHNLNLRSLEGLTFGNIRNSSGGINGQLHLSGTLSRPRILGDVHTNQLRTTVSMLNAPFTMPQETISFTKRGLEFNNFTILDVNNRKATLDGRVVSRDFSRFYLNLDVNTDHWQAINSTQRENELFYGKVFVSSDLNISGSATAPSINGNLTVHDSTDFYYALIDDGPGMQETEGIVQFIDGRDTTNYYEAEEATAKIMSFSPSTQMNVNINIEENAIFNVVIDPITGDNLQVKGEAALNTFIGPNGSVGLTGTYELNDGYYELNYNFLRRRFKIQEGSVLTLAGDPMDAEVKITAKYIADLAPYDLVENNVDQEQMVYYKQRLPFEIVLQLNGKIMQPEVTFDIQLNESEAGTASSDVVTNVQRKLNEIRTNPSELNKQVFAALIFNRFVGDDPFSSGDGVDVEYAARQSVSRFLSSQLNMLADNLISGFEVNLDLSSSQDYSSGTKTNRTDLNVSASKRLFNDRLTVSVGNDFQLEGRRTDNQQSSLIPGNISVDYRITPDGRYMVRVYRKNELQNVIEGYEIETGITFRISVEYNRFRSLFMSRKKYREYLRSQREKAIRKEEETEKNTAG